MYDNWKAIDMERQKLENQYIDKIPFLTKNIIYYS